MTERSGDGTPPQRPVPVTPGRRAETVDVTDEGAVDTFNAGEVRESHRVKLSWAIILLLIGVVIVYMATALRASSDLWEQASWPLGNVLTAVIGLAGTTVGYYFGSNRD